MKKIILIILVFATYTFSQSAGSAGLSFLKFGFGAKNIAMGDAGSVTANDVTALFYNPAPAYPAQAASWCLVGCRPGSAPVTHQHHNLPH